MSSLNSSINKRLHLPHGQLLGHLPHGHPFISGGTNIILSSVIGIGIKEDIILLDIKYTTNNVNKIFKLKDNQPPNSLDKKFSLVNCVLIVFVAVETLSDIISYTNKIKKLH